MKPVIEKGYAVITRTWKAGDRIELELPHEGRSACRPSDQIEATRGKVALRYGPLIYNIEQVGPGHHQGAGARFSAHHRVAPDLLGGVMVIKGKFADGKPCMAIPNYARLNRDPAVSAEQVPSFGPPAPGQPRRATRPPTSIVWIREA